MSYDVIVVGARCAGAPTAMLLAGRGYRVLLVDAAHFPSDMPLSTHLIWPSGAQHLKEWGLLEKVAESGCPPVRNCLLDLGPLQLEGEPVPAGDVRDAYAPRRFVLDRILGDAAVQAGVELRQEFRVHTLIWDGDAAVGVRGEAGGSEIEEKARIIVGADGRNSRIAQLVQPDTYDEVSPLQGTYFAYWRGLPLDRIELHVRPRRGVYAFPTNDGLTLVGINWAMLISGL